MTVMMMTNQLPEIMHQFYVTDFLSSDDEDERHSSDDEDECRGSDDETDSCGKDGEEQEEGAKDDQVEVVLGFKVDDFDLFDKTRRPKSVVKIGDSLKKCMDKHTLKFTSDIPNLVHDSSISGATASAYKKHFHGFYQFAAVTGDYQAILLLSYHKFENYHYASAIVWILLALYRVGN
jgi:hypothetical protein